jgi:hypothetical protein
MTVSNEVGNKCKEAVVTYFKVLFQHFPTEKEERYCGCCNLRQLKLEASYYVLLWLVLMLLNMHNFPFISKYFFDDGALLLRSII